ncbi:hypothetical protein RUND412_006132 [Rhizina undulata]
MRAINIQNGAGPASALFFDDDVPVPVPASGQLLVRVKAFGLNRMDVLQRNGHYPLPPQTSKILGVEFSGIVEDLGPEVADFKPGDEVFGLAYGGAYAEFIAVSAKTTFHLPKYLTHIQAAGIPEAWITATQALFTVGNFKPSDKVLIHAAASGVGLALTQLCHLHGASAIYTTAGSEKKLQTSLSLGATAAYNYKTTSFSRSILDATDGYGVDLIVDFVAASHFQQNLEVAATDGRMVMLALLSGGIVDKADISPILRKRLRIEGSSLRTRDLEYQEKLKEMVLKEVLPGFEDGRLKLFIEKVFSWKDIIAAHELMESNTTTGKIVCTVD